MTALEEVIDLKQSEALRLCKDTTDIDVIIALTKHEKPVVRQRALREMCPCRVKEDIDDFWIRVVQMVEDPADNVRQQVMFPENTGKALGALVSNATIVAYAERSAGVPDGP